MAGSYRSVDAIARSKIVGFEVRPVTERSEMYRSSVPSSNMSRLMLSSQTALTRFA